MAITEERPAAVAPTPAVDLWTSHERLAGLLLALTWVGVIVSMLVVGEREGSYAQLEGGLRAGEVSEVEVIGELPPGARGFETVTLRWRDGLVTRTANVTESSRERPSRDPQPVVVGSVEDRLRALDPDVRVVHGGDLRRYTYSVDDWYVPGWLALLGIGVFISTLGLISGPRPWRATRWAWAWLVLMVPLVGVPAYFLFGGPTGVFRPKDPQRVWLTGGWAFLLALLLGGGSGAS